MTSTSADGIDPAFAAAIGRLGPALVSGLGSLEKALRRLHPPAFASLRLQLVPVRDALDEALKRFLEAGSPEGLEAFCDALTQSAEFTREALCGLADPPPPEQAARRTMLSMHQHARAQAMLYPLRHVLPPVSAFFAEPFCRDALDALEALEDSDARVGLFRGGEAEARGGFDLYVPESWDGREALPLIVALHGGLGNGADFLWSWLREARSRRCLLLAPTSRGSTWSLDAPELDGRALAELVEWLTARWKVDRDRVLLTGLSDGATMTLLVGLGEDAPYTHLAPISGVLHPRNFALGNLERARAKPIRLVHGALDWLFPVSLAREAARVLEQAGADLAYHEIGDLSHTYPREENARLIEWLDPTRGAAVQPTPGES
jgi:phospholipase/carboxylesterase